MTTQRVKTLINQELSQAQIRRSVASSSAIETGESSVAIETRLKSGKRKFPELTLAN
ncbi:hypothetical protein [Oceanisphaera ostreae]|uniref:KfrA N-terminal DNA-binding domain-containing protein n=1 Tax=Oceanisphaera ostreae TaxID=914151 RepID=A0ABW3KCN3_9GAMM